MAIRLVKKHEKLLRFLVSGGLAAAVEYSLFLVLRLSFSNELVSLNTVSFIGGLFVSFNLNKHWVFDSKGGTMNEFFPYLVLAIINLVLSGIIISCLVGILNIQVFIAKFLVMALIATWNYFIFSKIIFKIKS